jgi:hypothetical protein
MSAAIPIRRSGPSEAARRGAVAYLLRSLGTDSHRLIRLEFDHHRDRRSRRCSSAASARTGRILCRRRCVLY